MTVIIIHTDHPHRILIIGGSGSEKTNALLHLIKEQDDIDKIYLYARDLSEPKYEFVIKKRKYEGTKHFSYPMHLLSVQIQWMTFMTKLMTTTQTGKEKF